MTHKKMFQFLTLSLFVAMVVVLPLQAAPDCGKPGCPKKGDQEKMMGKDCMTKAEGCMMLKAIPNLSDEQKGKLEKLHAEHQAVMAAAMAEMQKKCQAHYEAVKALLTDEQKAKLPEMGACMKGGMMMHKHGGCMMEQGKKMDHGKCQKAEEEKKEEQK